MRGEQELLTTATAVRRAVSLLKRRTRQTQTRDLSVPETAVMVRLDHSGPDSISGLARWEQITPQAMGATVGGLESRGLLHRVPDPDDKRRHLLSLTEAGTELLRAARDDRTEQIARALADNFTPEEIAEIRRAAALFERIAQFL